ncbi:MULTISPECIES: FkbM family methyltransferase [Mycobacteriaceae]|uniref:FkbM family methyltransferase n=1 Tax=Mycolicibacterium parafortuitum TaxID=39692 RepID=A0ACC6MEJ6_MYCPF|nr:MULTISPECIES: FkbM family methyltransferase [Mycobacteriaceae]MDZ5085411.1 FkbM family methyltransferase [Mycolicibacterium parafortuitum]
MHDEDFYSLTTLGSATGLALDIGANSGQSAISILAIKPEFQVVCFEPNPSCLPPLQLNARLFRSRVRVIHAGAGDAEGELPFYVPVRNGRSLLEEGTFNRSELGHSEYRIGREGVDYQVSTIQCPVMRVDDLNLEPVFVKIDVQGYEVDVLRGMSSTIERARPLILIEDGVTTSEVLELLTPLGYVQKYWDGAGLTDRNIRNSGNFLMCPLPGAPKQ